MIGIRKALDLIFTESELRILDDILPSFKRHEKLDDEDRKVICCLRNLRGVFFDIRDYSSGQVKNYTAILLYVSESAGVELQTVLKGFFPRATGLALKISTQIFFLDKISISSLTFILKG